MSMGWVYKKHYTRDEARELLPKVQVWLEKILALRDQLAKDDQVVSRLLKKGEDAGGSVVNRYARTMIELKGVLMEFASREIQIKDIDRGLIDFPGFVGGKEVFLCWEKGEDDIEFWHDLDTGYAGREPL